MKPPPSLTPKKNKSLGDAPEQLIELQWYQKLSVMNVSVIIFLIAVLFSANALEGSGRQLNYLENFINFAREFFPPDLSVLSRTMRSLLETVQIAVMATFFAIFLSVPIAALAAQNIAPRWVVICARQILNMIRTIPSLIWALIAVAIVGANSQAGVVALTFYSMGYLGKFFSEAFESVNMDTARSLRGIGADPIQAFQYGLWPHARPLIWSYSLWMLEYNIRSATIIGYVGAGGLGLELHTYQEYHQWARFSTVLLAILVVVTFLDFFGEWIRHRVMSRTNKATLSE